jgi:hypothetical protein
MNADRTSKPLVDPECFALAEHFLSDLEGDEATEAQRWQLAKEIQDAIEAWFDGRA